MSEARKNPDAAHLPVLPSSGKADQLRHEFQTERKTAPMNQTETPATTPASDAPVPTDHLKSIENKLLEGKVIEAIRQVYDPEIPVNIYELGLIYNIDIADDKSVKVRMTLTAPGCPVAGSLPGEVASRIEAIPEVKEADVELVWEPPWDKSMMSEVAQLQLGIF